MRIICRISFLDKTTGEEILKSAREEKVYMGTIPLMTTYGTFVINGVERVVVSQLHRSPGLIFDHDKGKTHSSGKLLYASRVIPYRGSWLDFEFDHKDLVYIRIDRRRKLLASILLKALGMANQEILETFYESETYSVTPQGFSLKINSRRLMGRISPVEIKDKDGKETIVEKGQRITARHIRLIDSNKIKIISLDSEGLNGLITAEDIINKETGELLISCNSVIDETIVKAIQEQKLKEIKVLYINELESGPYISETLRSDTTTSQLEALAEIYRMMRPGEPPTNSLT
jgi:DNA-directed RNA polymerase subunit beta